MSTLEEKTQAYWGVQSAYNQRPGIPQIAVCDAIAVMNKIVFSTGPSRVLLKHCWGLRNEIIYGNLAVDKETTQNG